MKKCKQVKAVVFREYSKEFKQAKSVEKEVSMCYSKYTGWVIYSPIREIQRLVDERKEILHDAEIGQFTALKKKNVSGRIEAH